MGIFRSILKTTDGEILGTIVPWKTIRAYRGFTGTPPVEIGVIFTQGGRKIPEIIRMKPEIAKALAIDLLKFYIKSVGEGKC